MRKAQRIVRNICYGIAIISIPAAVIYVIATGAPSGLSLIVRSVVVAIVSYLSGRYAAGGWHKEVNEEDKR